jgi:uncharacterized membrane protein (UPF0127 family)
MFHFLDRKIINFVGFGAILLVLFAGVSTLLRIDGSDLKTTHQVTIAGTEFSVAIADTQTERFKGLSNYEKIDDREGMWFEFDTPSEYGFVMRQMNFPLDIIWITEDKQIVGAAENAQPSSYPGTTFKPPQPVRYVLELPAGSVDRYDINSGTTIEGPN